MVAVKKPEILSPAGDMECLTSAVRFGADAVFLAGKEFGMRTAAVNFQNPDLKSAIDIAHKENRKVYITCNILPRNDEISRMPDFLSYIQGSCADALIISDLGVLSLAQKYAPKVPVHISTQAGVVNYMAARQLYNMGAKRIVLARELSIWEIKEIRAKIPEDLEIECFVHGAMCVSFSGRCLISNYLTGRDANRGDCAQPCRWKYYLYEENREGQFFEIEENKKGTYLYNANDLCMIEHIPELIDAGISSFKIEGRAKSAYYTAVTANAYRRALDDYMKSGPDAYTLKTWIKEELEKISHREYCSGFFFGNSPGQETSTGGYIRKYDVVAVCVKSEGTNAIITQRNKFYTGDTLDVLPPDGVPFETAVLKITNKKGETVDSAPHPMETLYLETTKTIPADSFIRKQRQPVKKL